MTSEHTIFLVPGFFGFANLGGLRYFAHVTEKLESALSERGMRARIVPVATSPTGSIRQRAANLLETVLEHAPRDDSPIHLIGHSTGGLDARMLVTPAVSLTNGSDPEPMVDRVRSVLTVSTPHYGTPLASFFSTVLGAQMLRLFSLSTVYVLRFGHMPLSVMLKLGAVFVRLDDRLGFKRTLADQVFDELLGDFSSERRAEVHKLLEQMTGDQSLFTQLKPEGVDVFNASATDRPGVSYGCVITAAEPTGLRSLTRVGLDPYLQASHALFASLYRVTGRRENRGPRPVPLPAEVESRLGDLLGEPLGHRDNDGVVPSRFQVWGEPIHAARADHLDTVGHFDGRDHDPPHYDWLASGSGFSRDEFDRLWCDVADFLVRAADG
ncbi:MAG: triacylglycerol lipase [Polyangia bacterium]